MRLYKFLRAILRPICLVLFPRKAHYTTELPTNGPLILCANHISYIDPVFMGLEFKQPLHFIAKKEACSAPVIGPILRGIGAFPVDREGKDIKAIRTCMNVLKEGNTLGIFPEGTRVINKTSQAKAGIALIAKRSKAPIVMAHIVPKKGRVRLFSKTDIYFSRVYSYNELCGDLDYAAASEKILKTIYSLGE